MATEPNKELVELTDKIYDTLMRNVGRWENHVPFDTDKVKYAEVYHAVGLIYFDYDGTIYSLVLKKEEYNPWSPESLQSITQGS